MSYVAPFVPFEGAIPFYPPTLFGTPPSVAVRMRGTTWSTAVDIQSETLTAGLGRHVTLQDLREFKDTSGTVLRCRRELGVHVHKGGGTLDKVTIMTLVPRFILMCNLPQPTQVAQVGMLGGPYVSLQPGELAPLHWPHVDQPRMICIRYVLLNQYCQRQLLRCIILLTPCAIADWWMPSPVSPLGSGAASASSRTWATRT